MKIQHLLIACSCFVFAIVNSYPITSQPLTNNPDSWALEDSWLIFNPKNVLSQAQPLISNYDPRAKKITAKSIFIAPNSNFLGNSPTKSCQPGQRIDENGNCIKIVTVNQDELLIHQLQQLLQHKSDTTKTSTIDYDDYDYDESNENVDESQGPLQVNLPLVFESEPERNIKETTTIQPTTLPKTELETTTLINDDDLTTTTMETLETTTEALETTTKILDTTTETWDTTTETMIPDTTTTEIPDATTTTEPNDEFTTTTLESTETTTIFPEEEQETTTLPTTTTTTTTTVKPSTTTTWLPISVRLKNHRTKGRKSNSETLVLAETSSNSRRQKTTPQKSSSSSNIAIIDRFQLPKKNEILTTTTESPTTTAKTLSQWPPPMVVIPKASELAQRPNSPKIIRFWTNMPLVEDTLPVRTYPPFAHSYNYQYNNNRRRSHSSGSYRLNSRQPTEKLFREVTFQELQSVLRV